MIKCEDILQKTYFDSYSEFFLACCIARECMCRGDKLDMSNMRIDSDILPENELSYFKCLWRDGAIYLGKEYSGSMGIESSYYIDTDCFADYYNVLFKEEPDKYYWSMEWASKAYEGNQNLQNISWAGKVLMHLVGHMLVCFYLGEREKKPMEIEITGQQVKSTYIYVNLVSCLKTLLWLDEVLILNIDFTGYNIDIDYSILCNNGIAAKRNKLWSIKDKYKFLEKEGITDGMIVILWSRRGMCESNPAGRITGATLVRINEICEDSISVETLPYNKTKEEREEDFLSIPEEKRYSFIDMKYSVPKGTSRMLSLYDIGIENYFDMEDEFITKIDRKAMVTKKITVDGKVSNVDMNNVDAIYWLLCQYEVDFDRELYRNVYNNGNPLLWDKYGELVD